jgi:hypothetical protein
MVALQGSFGLGSVWSHFLGCSLPTALACGGMCCIELRAAEVHQGGVRVSIICMHHWCFLDACRAASRQRVKSVHATHAVLHRAACCFLPLAHPFLCAMLASMCLHLLSSIMLARGLAARVGRVAGCWFERYIRFRVCLGLSRAAMCARTILGLQDCLPVLRCMCAVWGTIWCWLSRVNRCS